jgi:sugar (pentulose or hexulose) kinase
MYLVLNLGLKSIRAIVFSRTGKIVANNSTPLSTILDGVVVEQNATEWWEKGLQVINSVLENDNVRNNIKYLTVTASSCCVVPVKENGLPLNNVIMVSDKRAHKECAYIVKCDSYQKVREGRSEFEIKSSLMLPKILWLKNNKPSIFTKAKYFFSPNEYFGYRITRKALVDTLNAEKCFYDINSQSYPLQLLCDLGIPVKKLSKVVNVGDKITQITSDFKNLINIPDTQSVEYIVSTYDAICAFYGSGASKEGDCCDVSGTVSSLRTMSKGKVSIDSTAIFSQYQPEFDISIIGGSNNLGGGLIEWAKQAFYSEHSSPYELMESDAKSVKSGADGVIFLPYLMGERAPLWNDDARAVFFGLSRNHNRKHIIRAVFESTAFAMRSLLEEIELSGQKVDVIRSSGGLSRIHMIAQIKADVLGKEIHIVDEHETTALGAFLIMGISTGIYNNLIDAAKVVRIRQVIFPNKEVHEMYSKVFTLYKKIYVNLLDCYQENSNLHKENIYSTSEKIENM